MWMHICQGLMLVGWLVRMTSNMVYAANGRKAEEASGAVGIIVHVIWGALAGVVLWKSGAVSTMVAP